jgi:hypothetical protein
LNSPFRLTSSQIISRYLMWIDDRRFFFSFCPHPESLPQWDQQKKKREEKSISKSKCLCRSVFKGKVNEPISEFYKRIMEFRRRWSINQNATSFFSCCCSW